VSSSAAASSECGKSGLFSKPYLRAKTQIIDLDYDLEKKVDETGLNYQELFSIYHTNGDDSILIDTHPNNFANELFSRRIFNDLKKE